MGKRDSFTKTLAIAGIVLLLAPVLAPVVFSLGTFGSPRGYTIDYLMPFEFYPVALVGMILVLWASLRGRLHRMGVGISIGLMIGGVVLGAVAANLTGIANSVETLEAWRYGVVIAIGALSLIGQIALAWFGIRMLLDMSAHAKSMTAGPAAPAA